MTIIKNTIIYQTGVLTNPAISTVLYDAGTTGDANGKGLADIFITASAPITVSYTTIYGKQVNNQIWTLTSPVELGSMAVNHLELAASLTGTLEVLGNELMS